MRQKTALKVLEANSRDLHPWTPAYAASVVAMIKAPLAVVFRGSSARRTSENSTGMSIVLSIVSNLSMHPVGMAVPPLNTIGTGVEILGILSVDMMTRLRLSRSFNMISS